MPRRRRSPASITPTYDPAIVKQYARNRWSDVLSNLGGIDIGYLDGGHHPCVKCGGKDRFRFTDRDGDGSLICNQCFRPGSGDGLGSLEWLRGCKFGEAVRLVAEYLGVPGSGGYQSNGQHGKGSSKTADTSQDKLIDPSKHLEPLPWNEAIASMWCNQRPPIRPKAIRLIGGEIARYRKRYTVVSIPVFGEEWFDGLRTISFDKNGSGAGKSEQSLLTSANVKVDSNVVSSKCDEKSSLDPDRHRAARVGRCIYNASGGNLPKYTRDSSGKQRFRTEWVKVKLTYGSRPGLLGTVDRLIDPACEVAWLVEGPTDVLAMLSATGVPPEVAVVTHSNGCGPLLDDWMVELFRGKAVYVVGDADRPGQDGAKRRANQVAAVARECRIVTLPFEISETHGKDLRDYFND